MTATAISNGLRTPRSRKRRERDLPPLRLPDSSARDCSYLFRSTDAGKTWRRHALIAAGYNETGLVRLRSGELLAAMRSQKAGDVWLTRSRDGGEHWEEPKQLTPANVHPADLILLLDGRVLLTCGDRTGPFGVDAVVGSADGHFEWADHFPLVTDATSRDCGYPSSVLLEGGRVLTVYYATGSKEHNAWGTHCGAAVFQPPDAPRVGAGSAEKP